MDKRTLQAIVAYISRSFSAACLLLWGVVNIAVLVKQYLGRGDGEQENWLVSFLLCLLFGVLPFCIGSWMLYRLVAATSKTPSGGESTPADR